MTNRSGLVVEIGGVIAGLGGAAATGLWIYAKTVENHSPWDWQMLLAIATLTLGVVAMGMGLISHRQDPTPLQAQRGGKGSRNLQAGRDLTIGRGEKE